MWHAAHMWGGKSCIAFLFLARYDLTLHRVKGFASLFLLLVLALPSRVHAKRMIILALFHVLRMSRCWWRV
jgi:hypothetical protein